MLDPTSIRSFSEEVQDLRGLSPDARAKRAELRGEEYLFGGQLPSNHPLETNFEPKLAAFRSETFTPGRSLKQGMDTRKFHDTDIHTTAKPDTPGVIGKKFRIE